MEEKLSGESSQGDKKDNKDKRYDFESRLGMA